MTKRALPVLADTLEELLRRWPSAAQALRRAGLCDCVGCAMAPFETLDDAVRTYGLDRRRVLSMVRAAARGESR